MINEALREQISAYVDGELSDAEAELLVRRLSQDAQLRKVVADYLAIGRAVRGESNAAIDGLRERVAGQLDEVAETVSAVEALPGSRSWAKPVAGVGIAATVAAIALVGLQTLGPVATPIATVSSDLAAIAIDEAPLYTEPPVEDVLSDRPGEMLTRYYQQHNDRTADIGGSGILTRLVELELRNDELEAPVSADESANDPDAADVSPAGRERD